VILAAFLYADRS